MEEILTSQHYYKKAFCAKWKEMNLTAVISPVWPHCSPKSENQDPLCKMPIEYVASWSFLTFPGGSIPVTTVQENEQTGYDQSFTDKFAKTQAKDMKDSAGMPIGVQVCSYPYEDEKAIAVM